MVQQSHCSGGLGSVHGGTLGCGGHRQVRGSPTGSQYDESDTEYRQKKSQQSCDGASDGFLGGTLGANDGKHSQAFTGTSRWQ